MRRTLKHTLYKYLLENINNPWWVVYADRIHKMFRLRIKPPFETLLQEYSRDISLEELGTGCLYLDFHKHHIGALPDSLAQASNYILTTIDVIPAICFRSYTLNESFILVTFSVDEGYYLRQRFLSYTDILLIQDVLNTRYGKQWLSILEWRAFNRGFTYKRIGEILQKKLKPDQVSIVGTTPVLSHSKRVTTKKQRNKRDRAVSERNRKRSHQQRGKIVLY